jgi:hypothetical protein
MTSELLETIEQTLPDLESINEQIIQIEVTRAALEGLNQDRWVSTRAFLAIYHQNLSIPRSLHP